jgi:dienelactone hydrolase
MVVTLTLLVNDTVVATQRITRMITTTEVTHQTVSLAQGGVFGVLVRPVAAPGKHPAVLIIGGSEGGLHGTTEAEALASRGYAALALAYFGEDGLPATLTSIPLEYFAAALRILAGQPGVDPDRIIVEGASRGSEAALLLATHYPDLVHAVIALSPSSKIHSGWPDETKPAWTWKGVGLPYARSYDADPGHDPAAVIPVENIHASLFLLCGEDDQLWASCAYEDAIVQRWTDHHVTYRLTALREPDAGHLIDSVLPNRPQSSKATTIPPYGTAAIGGTQQADALGRLDAWPKLLAFLASP